MVDENKETRHEETMIDVEAIPLTQCHKCWCDPTLTSSSWCRDLPNCTIRHVECDNFNFHKAMFTLSVIVRKRLKMVLANGYYPTHYHMILEETLWCGMLDITWC